MSGKENKTIYGLPKTFKSNNWGLEKCIASVLIE